MSDDFLAEEKRKEEKDKLVLEQVKGLLSERDFNNVLEGFKDCMHVTNFEIVDNAKGEPQHEDWEHGDRICNQTCGGGFSGDSFSGDDYIPLPDNKFFKYSYWC